MHRVMRNTSGFHTGWRAGRWLLTVIMCALLSGSTGSTGLAATPALNSVGAVGAASVGAPQQLPPNFKLTLYTTSGLDTPRFPSFSPEGDLYVADIATGKIMVYPDRNHDGQPDRAVTFASGLNNPNNVVFRNGSVYVGELGRVLRLADTDGDLVSDSRSVLIDGLQPTAGTKLKP